MSPSYGIGTLPKLYVEWLVRSTRPISGIEIRDLGVMMHVQSKNGLVHLWIPCQWKPNLQSIDVVMQSMITDGLSWTESSNEFEHRCRNLDNSSALTAAKPIYFFKFLKYTRSATWKLSK